MSAETAEPTDDAALAAEYVLGLVAAAERAAFEARLAVEPALRGLVADWAEAFVRLTDGIAPVAPPPEVRARLEARLFADRPVPQRSRFSLGRLFGGVLAGGLVAAMLIFLLPFVLSPPAPPGPVYTATIAADPVGLVVEARFDPATGTLRVNRTQGAPAPGRSLQLWIIAANAAGPVSLGVIDEPQAEIRLPGALSAAFDGATLAISDEPQGGSPTGSPTNVLGAGEVTLL